MPMPIVNASTACVAVGSAPGADPAPETEALAKRIRAEAPTSMEDHRKMEGEPQASLLVDPRLVGRSAEHACLVGPFEPHATGGPRRW
jgi:hypothetical protein